MNELKFAFDQAPDKGQRIAIVPGIDWIRLPMPFALDHVNCWLLHDTDSPKNSCLIDTGVYTKETLECWEQVLAETGHPEKLLVTHFHPDHSGLAGWFAENGSDVISSAIEWGVVQTLNHTDDETFVNYYANWYSENGIEQSYIDVVHKAGNTYKSRAYVPPADIAFLADGDSVELGGRFYKVMTGQGHSPDMLMLHCEAESLLIVADQVLPSITPNVSLMPKTADLNPLDSFLKCIERLRELPEETLVLPSHGLPFTGLHQRIAFLADHHRQRLNEVEQALAEEQTAAALFPLLFKRKLDHQQLSFALGETLAHLTYLESQSRVVRHRRDGVDYYRATN